MSELPPLEPIGTIVSRRFTPPGTLEFWGFFTDGGSAGKQLPVVTIDQARAYATLHASNLEKEVEWLERKKQTIFELAQLNNRNKSEQIANLQGEVERLRAALQKSRDALLAVDSDIDTGKGRITAASHTLLVAALSTR